MFQIKFENPNEISKPKNYGEVVTYLANHTQAHYLTRPLGKAQESDSSFDVSQVCCWVCEKPLVNGMKLCQMAQDRIEVVPDPSEPIATEDDAVPTQSERQTEAYFQKIEDFILICGDCAHGLAESSKDPGLHKKILNETGNPIPNPLDDSRNFIKPTISEHWGSRTFTSEQCFVYSRKLGWARFGSRDPITKEFLIQTDDIKSQVFVEPNPELPYPLQLKALNTIRLFRLNGLNYDYESKRYHSHLVDLSQGTTQYDDMRVVSRNKAFLRARTAFNQMKNLREAGADLSFYQMILSQHRLIMELNGFRSVWAKVFYDGNDPGGLSDLLETPPLPVDPPRVHNEGSVLGIDQNLAFKGNIVDFVQTQINIEDQLRDALQNLMKENGELLLRDVDLIIHPRKLKEVASTYQSKSNKGKRRDDKEKRKEMQKPEVIRLGKRMADTINFKGSGIHKQFHEQVTVAVQQQLKGLLGAHDEEDFDMEEDPTAEI